MSQISTPSSYSGYDSIINVLTRGSSISPISLEELRKHLTETDPTSWRRIRETLTHIPYGELQDILTRVSQVPRLQYSILKLIEMLLTLEDDVGFHEKLNSHEETVQQ